MRPSEQSKKAYSRGFDAYGRGQEQNPYRFYSLKRGGPILSGWFDAGYQDAEAGRPRRFHVEQKQWAK